LTNFNHAKTQHLHGLSLSPMNGSGLNDDQCREQKSALQKLIQVVRNFAVSSQNPAAAHLACLGLDGKGKDGGSRFAGSDALGHLPGTLFISSLFLCCWDKALSMYLERLHHKHCFRSHSALLIGVHL
jgi:hypothetical protein